VVQTWDAALQRFGDLGAGTDAVRAYISLLEGARQRWQSVIAVHPWRLDVLVFTPRAPSPHQVQADYRVRDGHPIVIFRLGPARNMDALPSVTGDICRLETAPAVLDAFLLQIAGPDASTTGVIIDALRRASDTDW
jgi:hypothetical protein